MQAEIVRMAASNIPHTQSPGACDLPVEKKGNKENAPEHRVFQEPRGGGWGQTIGKKSGKAIQRETTSTSLHGNDSDMHVQAESPADRKQIPHYINYDY